MSVFMVCEARKRRPYRVGCGKGYAGEGRGLGRSGCCYVLGGSGMEPSPYGIAGGEGLLTRVAMHLLVAVGPG